MRENTPEKPDEKPLTHALEALLGGLGPMPDLGRKSPKREVSSAPTSAVGKQSPSPVQDEGSAPSYGPSNKAAMPCDPKQESVNSEEKMINSNCQASKKLGTEEIRTDGERYKKDQDDVAPPAIPNRKVSSISPDSVGQEITTTYEAEKNNSVIPGLFLYSSSNANEDPLHRKPLSSDGDMLDVVTSNDLINKDGIHPLNSNTNSTTETPIISKTANINFNGEENAEWENDSSPLEDTSDEENSSSDDSSSNDSEEGEDSFKLLTPEEQARILMAGDGGSDDEGIDKLKGPGGQLRTKNEILEVVIPKTEVTITQDMPIIELGVVEQIVENLILIKANISGEYKVLESGSVLCLSDRSVIGVIAETMGRVQQPLYSVMFNNAIEISEARLSVGAKIFYSEKHATYVFTKNLKAIKGSDASNINDEEVGDDEIEFSDDEAEAEHKRKVKQKRQEKRDGKTNFNGNSKRGRQPSQKLPQIPEGSQKKDINYEDDEPYKPLPRPAGYANHIVGCEATSEDILPTGQAKPSFGNKNKNGGRGNRNRPNGNRGRKRANQKRRGPAAATSTNNSYQQAFDPSLHTAAYQNPPLGSHNDMLSQTIPGTTYGTPQCSLNMGQFPEYENHQPFPQQWPPLFPAITPFPQFNPYQSNQTTFNNWANINQPLPNGAFINPAFFNQQIGHSLQENQQNGQNP
ncbi:putative snornp assembly factor naf1 [Golovinomyces cichoracearum]|uniref:H/ACA ribonucleoprotein complex non-core subunit NAF1 n=1 Tax=Golovinomyces cichoracearum TaxID=62708 RepID=A0A420J7Y4_9PEZI|nr:putative snornp assembly factor naf1 [Golovinomyces cichoracearum]